VIALSPTGGTTGMPKGVMNTHRSVQTFFAHFMLACTYRDGATSGEPGCRAHDAHRRPAVRALHGTGGHRGDREQARSLPCCCKPSPGTG
jgi:acyl-CoA synthetase (AMP-forming)/AMP-acid ligase II